MPVFNSISGSWNLATVGASGGLSAAAIIAQNVNTEYNLTMSPVSAIAGSGQTMIRKMDNIDASVSIDGPFLITTNSFLNGDYITDPVNYPCYDVYGFVKKYIAPTIKNDAVQNKFWGLKNMNLKFGSDGATSNASWWMDPEIFNSSIIPPIPWINNYDVGIGDGGDFTGSGITSPLRQANWYDFYFSTGSGAFIVQDYNIDIEYSYDQWNPLGGAALIANEIYPTSLANYSNYWNHATVKILKSINIKFTLNGIIHRTIARPLWGQTVVSDPTYPYAGISNQGVCSVAYEDKQYDIYTYCTGGSTIGIIDDFLSSISTFSKIGEYITSAKSNIKPGIMTSTISGEYIIPIYGNI